MKPTTLLIVLLITTAALDAQEWIAYTSADSSLRVHLPTEPVETLDTLEDESGTITISSIYSTNLDTAISKNISYLITVLTYPTEVDTVDAYQSSIVSISDQMLGRLDYVADDIDFGGKKARITLPHKEQVCRLVTFADGRRIYTLQVFSPLVNSINEETDYFFESFTLL